MNLDTKIIKPKLGVITVKNIDGMFFVVSFFIHR